VGYFDPFDILPIVRKKRNATTANKIKNRGSRTRFMTGEFQKLVDIWRSLLLKVAYYPASS
jgi:hypothetical protein